MFFKTLLPSFILILLSLFALSIGLILTGKPKLKKGCGKKPESSCKEGECGTCNCLKKS